MGYQSLQIQAKNSVMGIRFVSFLHFFFYLDCEGNVHSIFGLRNFFCQLGDFFVPGEREIFTTAENTFPLLFLNKIESGTGVADP